MGAEPRHGGAVLAAPPSPARQDLGGKRGWEGLWALGSSSGGGTGGAAPARGMQRGTRSDSRRGLKWEGTSGSHLLTQPRTPLASL